MSLKKACEESNFNPFSHNMTVSGNEQFTLLSVLYWKLLFRFILSYDRAFYPLLAPSSLLLCIVYISCYLLYWLIYTLLDIVIFCFELCMFVISRAVLCRLRWLASFWKCITNIKVKSASFLWTVAFVEFRWECSENKYWYRFVISGYVFLFVCL